jgi:hypothetical protein
MKLVDAGDGVYSGYITLLVIYLIGEYSTQDALRGDTILLLASPFAGMACLALRGYHLKKTASKQSAQEGMHFHFHAGAKFGAVIVFLNMCAQYIGGIVMVRNHRTPSRYKPALTEPTRCCVC